MNRSYASPVPVKSLVPCTSLMGSPLSLRPKILLRRGWGQAASATLTAVLPSGVADVPTEEQR